MDWFPAGLVIAFAPAMRPMYEHPSEIREYFMATIGATNAPRSLDVATTNNVLGLQSLRRA